MAIGLAVPTIEASYLCGEHPRATEAAFLQGHWRQQRTDLRCELKCLVYDTHRPSLAAKTERAEEAARRLAGDLPLLHHDFPFGFGALGDDVAGWDFD